MEEKEKSFSLNRRGNLKLCQLLDLPSENSEVFSVYSEYRSE